MTDPTLTITLNQQEVSLILGAIAETLNIMSGDIVDANAENEAREKQIMEWLEALQTKLMNATWQ